MNILNLITKIPKGKAAWALVYALSTFVGIKAKGQITAAAQELLKAEIKKEVLEELLEMLKRKNP